MIRKVVCLHSDLDCSTVTTTRHAKRAFPSAWRTSGVCGRTRCSRAAHLAFAGHRLLLTISPRVDISDDSTIAGTIKIAGVVERLRKGLAASKVFCMDRGIGLAHKERQSDGECFHSRTFFFVNYDIVDAK